MTDDPQPPSVLSLLLQTEFNATTLVPPLTLTPTTRAPSLPCGGIKYDFEIPVAIICGMCFVFGIIFAFFGYRCFKAVVFLIGFIVASLVIFLVCREESTLAIGVTIGISVGVGVVCGLATMLFKIFGLFVTGFHAGVLLSAAVLIVTHQFYHLNIVWIPLGIAVGLGVLCGLATLKWQRHFVIMATGVGGGAVVAVCLDYFLELFRMTEYAYNRFRVRESDLPCWYSWVILGIWPLIALIGIVVQYRVTARGYKHKDGSKKVKSHHIEMQKLQKQQSRGGSEVRLQKYQNLYRVRRCNGDIVAVSYLQSIQNHLSPEMQRIASTTHLPPDPVIPPPIPPPPPETPTTITTTLLSNSSTVTTIGPVTHVDEPDIADV